jgi:hypothetical protein
MTNSQTKTRGILMSSWSIQRYIAGCKTQTRRTRGLEKINENPNRWKYKGLGNGMAYFEALSSFLPDENREFLSVRLPYGGVGDSLYFKETAKLRAVNRRRNGYIDGFDLHFRADDAVVDYLGRDDHKPFKFTNWNPSIFMPRWASRFQEIPIIDVRVGRLHKTPTNDVLAEGIIRTDDGSWLGPLAGVPDFPYAHASEAYYALWDSINGKTMPASKNPWVFVYEFPIYQPEKAS